MIQLEVGRDIFELEMEVHVFEYEMNLGRIFQGEPGKDAKINGHNAVTLEGDNETVDVTPDAEDASKLHISIRGHNVYDTLTKVEPYFYDIRYKAIDYGFARQYMRGGEPVGIGGCSVKLNTVHRLAGMTFDWKYNNRATFAIHTAADNGRHEVWGVAGMDQLTAVMVDSGVHSDLYKVLPFMLTDGFNSKGLFAKMNVVHRYNGDNDIIEPSQSAQDEICALMLVRYILDHYDNVQQAVQGVTEYIKLYNHRSLIEQGYELHFMLADSSGSYMAIEFGEGEYRVTDVYDIMTNFKLADLETNDNNSVYTQVDVASGSGNPVINNGIDHLGSGLERWNILNAGHPTTVAQMQALMRSVYYSRAYTITAQSEKWFSEFVGGDVDLYTPADNPALVARLNEYVQKWQHRDRDTAEVWHTSHMCVYDLEANEMFVTVQEGTLHHKFIFESPGGVMTIDGQTPDEDGNIKTESLGLAKDNDVVHKTGDETIDGNKHFRDHIKILFDQLVDENSEEDLYEKLLKKQDIIENLDEIEAGAAKGATSVQSVNGQEPDENGNVNIETSGDVVFSPYNREAPMPIEEFNELLNKIRSGKRLYIEIESDQIAPAQNVFDDGGDLYFLVQRTPTQIDSVYIYPNEDEGDVVIEIWNTLTQEYIEDLDDIRSNAETGAQVAELVPAQASATNQLADKAFVNSTVQTGTANFRGNWATLAAVPTDASLYPADYAGNHTPTVNDYMVVQSDEEHEGATWRYKYSGAWATDGKAGWQAEYEVNETPMTAAQLAAINSGITAAEVTRLAGLTDKVFVAIYGVTTNQQITDAIANNKEVICVYSNRVFSAAFKHPSNGIIALTCFYSGNKYEVTCGVDDNWSNSLTQLQKTSNLVRSLSSSSTDTQYPSAKAVYDALQLVDKVFVAEYGVTTHAEIWSAFKSGKFCITFRYGFTYVIAVIGETTNAIFVSHGNNGDEKVVYVTPTNSYGEVSRKLETINNRQTTIPDNPDDTHYPTSKAVKTYALANTPSGDPMHYMYMEAGAVWNASTGYWELNGITDLTTAEIRKIYRLTGVPKNNWSLSGELPQLRTTFPLIGTGIVSYTRNYVSRWKTIGLTAVYLGATSSPMEVLKVCDSDKYAILSDTTGFIFYGSGLKLREVIGNLDIRYVIASSLSGHTFFNSPYLEEIRLRAVPSNISMQLCSKLSAVSVAYMVNNIEATTAIIITLHATAYARAIADTDVQAALAAHTNVTLASA